MSVHQSAQQPGIFITFTCHRRIAADREQGQQLRSHILLQQMLWKAHPYIIILSYMTRTTLILHGINFKSNTGNEFYEKDHEPAVRGGKLFFTAV